MDSVVHFNMPATDRKRVVDFYSKVFGWTMKQYGPEMGNYILAHTTETDENGIVKNPGNINGGFFEKSERDNVTKLTIAVDDIEAAMKKVVAEGGTIIGGTKPGQVEVTPGLGKFIDIRDTEGNIVNLMEPERK
ncbi:MAG TPA: VOC family protein [Candidatus Nanoarchaeia archaeon]|nr:VOC family protein [Candidatus Nanoarchaeia archaeon]